jgi:predicted ATP-grasp superfamily ATP-dependent carboligase
LSTLPDNFESTIPHDTPIGSVSTPVLGALVVGGDHPGLGVARSLGRRGIPVFVIDDQSCISRFSRYTKRFIRVPNILDERKTVESVLEIGRRFNLRNWVLIPTRDETVAAFSRYRSELSDFFTVSTGEWNSVQWAWDKKKTYELAESLGIPCPKTFSLAGEEELHTVHERLPLAIKPAIKENFFYATHLKALRCDSIEQLHENYERVRQRISTQEILIQEIIPGDGREQYSWCAFVRNGQPHSTLIARRFRQHPREFGRAATYVETADLTAISELSERFVRAINYHGLVEIEYKRDPRDGKYKLLDVNARAWGFHILGAAAGVDFAWLLYADKVGIPIRPANARPGVGWLRFMTDLPTAASDLVHGDIRFGDYLKSLAATRVESVFAWADPMPFAAEMALLPWIIAKKLPSKT